MKDSRVSTVIAAIALFIVIGGSATAASGLIDGKKIKAGSVSAKQIKNKTITTAKLSPATVKSLKGATGPAGATGAAGAPGATGATGPAGVMDLHGSELLNFNLPNGEQTVALDLDVPTGQYLITAKLNVVSHKSNGSNSIDCGIWTDEESGVDRATSDATFNESVNLSMVAVAPVEGLIELRCATWDGPGQANNLKLIAQPISG